MKKKKVSLRKCVACGENKAKKELIRIVRDKDSNVFVDATGKANGRGAYICSKSECLDLVEKNKKLARALETDIAEEIYNTLKDVIGSQDSN